MGPLIFGQKDAFHVRIISWLSSAISGAISSVSRGRSRLAPAMVQRARLLLISRRRLGSCLAPRDEMSDPRPVISGVSPCRPARSTQRRRCHCCIWTFSHVARAVLLISRYKAVQRWKTGWRAPTRRAVRKRCSPVPRGDGGGAVSRRRRREYRSPHGRTEVRVLAVSSTAGVVVA